MCEICGPDKLAFLYVSFKCWKSHIVFLVHWKSIFQLMFIIALMRVANVTLLLFCFQYFARYSANNNKYYNICIKYNTLVNNFFCYNTKNVLTFLFIFTLSYCLVHVNTLARVFYTRAKRKDWEFLFFRTSNVLHFRSLYLEFY